MELYIYIIIFIFGSIMGSFLNVLAVRLSNNESIIYPRSHCHNCNHKLKWYELIISLIFISSLIVVIISDIEYMIILDEVIASSCIIIIILYLSLFGLEFTVNKILSAILAFITMYIIKLIGDHLFKRESMGGGDIKLMFLFGLVIGYPLSICNIFLATFIAFPIAIYLLLSRKDNLIPFGPFLAMAAILIHISKIDINSVIDFILK